MGRGLALLSCALLLASACDSDQGRVERMASALIRGRIEQVAIPPLTATFGTISRDEAIAVQERVVAWLESQGGVRAGYKIAFANPVTQELFGTDRPAAGVLFADQQVSDGGTFPAADMVGPLLMETEVVLVIGRTVEGPAADLAEVRAAVAAVRLGFDAAQLRYDPSTVRAADIIADDTAAYRWVVGAEIAPEKVDVDATVYTLAKDGAELAAAPGTAVLGGPYLALQWLVNDLAARGRPPLRPGDLVFTGAIAAREIALDGVAGAYRGTGGALGTIDLAISP